MARMIGESGQKKDGKDKRLERITSPYGDTFLPADECMPGCERSDGGCAALGCDYFDRAITRLGRYEDAGIATEDMGLVKDLLRRDTAARPVRGVDIGFSTWSEAYKCPACGGDVIDRAAFCHNCGKHLRWGD